MPSADDEVNQLFKISTPQDMDFKKTDEEGLKRTIRQYYSFWTRNEIQEKGGFKCYQTIVGWPFDLFVITDNPIVIDTIPNEILDFSKIELLMPISSRLMFCTHLSENFDFQKIVDYNQRAFDQAKKFVASNNKETLDGLVTTFRETHRPPLSKIIVALRKLVAD